MLEETVSYYVYSKGTGCTVDVFFILFDSTKDRLHGIQFCVRNRDFVYKITIPKEKRDQFLDICIDYKIRIDYVEGTKGGE